MPPPVATKPVRLLVVDDSAYNRRNIADVFVGQSDVEVVGKAADGEESLKLVTLLKPDVITLDLEMPRMDGFTFLRILMAKQPTPVIVVSSYAQRENVFKALELGALDFVPKPDRLGPEAVDVREEILQKVRVIRSLRPTFVPSSLVRRQTSGAWTADGQPTAFGATPAVVAYKAPRQIVAIASSTGGPSALLTIFGRIPTTTTSAFVVAQHMPDKFTRTFAERLDKRGPVRTAEAQDGDIVAQRTGFVCPGRKCMELVLTATDARLRVVPSASTDRYVPSADRLLTSVAVAGARVVGVILTGMGDDGLEGARAIRAAGGIVIAESQETAIVNGMPGAVVRAGRRYEGVAARRDRRLSRAASDIDVTHSRRNDAAPTTAVLQSCELFIERHAADPEERGGARSIAPRHPQRDVHRSRLERGEICRQPDHERVVLLGDGRDARRATHRGEKIFESDLGAVAEDQRRFDDVAQLAQVARPTVGAHRFECVGREPLDMPPHGASKLGERPLRESVDVVFAVA